MGWKGLWAGAVSSEVTASQDERFIREEYKLCKSRQLVHMEGPPLMKWVVPLASVLQTSCCSINLTEWGSKGFIPDRCGRAIPKPNSLPSRI